MKILGYHKRKSSQQQAYVVAHTNICYPTSSTDVPSAVLSNRIRGSTNKRLLRHFRIKSALIFLILQGEVIQAKILLLSNIYNNHVLS